MWCLSKSVHVLSMECYDWICYRFPNLKKKTQCFHSNLVYAKVLKIRTGRLFLTLAFSPTLPELLSHTGNREATTSYFLELYSSNLKSKLCACYIHQKWIPKTSTAPCRDEQENLVDIKGTDRGKKTPNLIPIQTFPGKVLIPLLTLTVTIINSLNFS